MSVPYLRLDDGDEAARGLLAWLTDASDSNPRGVDAAKELLWMRTVLIEQRKRLPRVERARFTGRADRVMAKLAARRQSSP